MANHFPGHLLYWSRGHQGQERLAALSTSGELILSTDSNHMIQQDEPDLVVATSRRVYESIVTERSLGRLPERSAQL